MRPFIPPKRAATPRPDREPGGRKLDPKAKRDKERAEKDDKSKPNKPPKPPKDKTK